MIVTSFLLNPVVIILRERRADYLFLNHVILPFKAHLQDKYISENIKPRARIKDDYEMYNKSTRYNMKEKLIWSNICVQDPGQIHVPILYSSIYIFIYLETIEVNQIYLL